MFPSMYNVYPWLFDSAPDPKKSPPPPPPTPEPPPPPMPESQPVSTHVNVLLQSPNVRLAIHRTLSQRYYRLVDALIRADSDAAELVYCLRELERACRTTQLAIPPVEEAKERGGPHA